MTTQKIRVYGTQWCPDCIRTKKFLNDHEILFEWIDIDSNPEGRKYVESVNKGCRSVPTIVFSDGSNLVDPSNVQLSQKLSGLGMITI